MMYEKHWGFSYDDDYLMHYGIKGMKWKNHVYKKYNKLKKRFKHIFGSKSSKKKKAATKEKVSPEIKQLRSDLDAAFGKPIKIKNAESYKGQPYFYDTLSSLGNDRRSGLNWDSFCSINTRKLLSTPEFVNFKKELNSMVDKAYPNNDKKRRQLKQQIDAYVQNQARDLLFKHWQYKAKMDEESKFNVVTYEYEYYD